MGEKINVLSLFILMRRFVLIIDFMKRKEYQINVDKNPAIDSLLNLFCFPGN